MEISIGLLSRKEMEYRLSRHAEDELVIRSISRALLDQVLKNPDQIVEAGPGKNVYQSRVQIDGREFLIRAVVAIRLQPMLVITVYRTTQIERYWKKT